MPTIITNQHKKMKRKTGIQTHNSYVFIPTNNCEVTIYGSPNQKSIALHHGMAESITFTFSKNTSNLLEKYIAGLQNVLAEIKND